MTPDSNPPPKHAGGRPSDYAPSFCQKVDDYLTLCKDTRDGDKFIVKLPKLEGFAKYLGVSRQTLHAWGESHSEFLDALDRIKAEQKEKLIDSGLSGDYNSTIAKLVLSSDHDMREKGDLTSDGEKIGSVDQVIAQVEERIGKRKSTG